VADDTFVYKCIFDTLTGLSEGLSHFSGPSRAAVIYAVDADDPFSIYDPQNLLCGHEPRLQELYLGRKMDRRPPRIFIRVPFSESSPTWSTAPKPSNMDAPWYSTFRPNLNTRSAC
jgi:hypothetical protein